MPVYDFTVVMSFQAQVRGRDRQAALATVEDAIEDDLVRIIECKRTALSAPAVRSIRVEEQHA